MDNASSQPVRLPITAKMAGQLENFKSYLPFYDTFQEAVFVIEGLLDYTEATITQGLVGELVSTGRLKADDGAQIPYSLWLDLFDINRKATQEKLNADEPFSPDFAYYRTRAAAIGWYYTQTILLPLPNFDLVKEDKSHLLDKLPLKMIKDFEGLPLYVPLKKGKFAGVLLSFQAQLASQEKALASLAEFDKTEPEHTLVISLLFDVLGRGNTNNHSVWSTSSLAFGSTEDLKEAIQSSTKAMTSVKGSLLADNINPGVVKACIDALVIATYFYHHLPNPTWIEAAKKINCQTNPETGAVEAIPPQADLIALTKEGSYPLYDSHFVLEIQKK